jgi:hypothetical protein
MCTTIHWCKAWKYYCILKFISILDRLIIVVKMLDRLPIFRAVRMTPHSGVDWYNQMLKIWFRYWSDQLIQFFACCQSESNGRYVPQETLAPRAARNKKSYVEDHQLDKNSNRKRRAVDAQEKPRRRSSRTVDTIVSLPLIDGAVAQVREWSFGNMPKKDASRFVRAVICAYYQHIWLFCFSNWLYLQISSKYALYLLVPRLL